MAIALVLVQFIFFFFPLISTIQLPQFSFFIFVFFVFKIFQFLAISLPKFLFPSSTSVTSFLSPLSYFFSEFQQWCYRNSLLSSFCQINLNSYHHIKGARWLWVIVNKQDIVPMTVIIRYVNC